MQLIQDHVGSTSQVHGRLLLVLRRKLPRKDRVFLVLHYLQGLSMEEVSRVMDCSVEEVQESIGRSMGLVEDAVVDQQSF